MGIALLDGRPIFGLGEKFIWLLGPAISWPWTLSLVAGSFVSLE